MSRNTIMDALKAKIEGVDYFETVSRKLVPWDQVPASQQPACFIYEHTEPVSHQSETFAKRGMQAELYVYTRADEPDAIPSAIMNAALDAIELALAPGGADILRQRQTLGGLVSHAYIDGDILKDPGDLDGQGVAVVPIRILVP